MAKQFDSRVGHGTFRLTKYKGQLIGVEIWPDLPEPRDPSDHAAARSYMVWRFPYRAPGPARKALGRLLRRRGKGGIVARDDGRETRDP